MHGTCPETAVAYCINSFSIFLFQKGQEWVVDSLNSLPSPPSSSPSIPHSPHFPFPPISPFWFPPILAFPPSLLPSFPPSLLPSFPPSLLPSFPPSLLPSFPPSLLPSFPHSLLEINLQYLAMFSDVCLLYCRLMSYVWCMMLLMKMPWKGWVELDNGKKTWQKRYQQLDC